MKMLVLANHMTWPEINSGGEKMFIDLCKLWSSKGVEVHLVIPFMNYKESKKMGLDVNYYTVKGFIIDDANLMRNHLFLIPIVWLIRTFSTLFNKVINNIRADIIYTTGDFYCNTIPAFWIKIRNPTVKWIAVTHHINESPLRRKGISFMSNLVSYISQRFSFFLIKKYADRFFVKNNQVKENFKLLGFEDCKFYIADNGINLKKINKITGETNPIYDACFLGRLHPTKGIFDLIKVWELVMREKKDAKLAIIGGGFEIWKKELEQIVLKKRLSLNIHILGYIPDTDAYRIRKSSKLHISTSYEEGWGISVAESLACKKPVIAYDLPVYSEKFGGIVKTVPKGDVYRFSKAILELLSDESLCNSLGERGYKFISKYDIEEIASKELDLMQALIK